MSEQVHCLVCGVLILATTAARTKGLCMPCKGGYRQRIEEGRCSNREEREYRRTDPFHKLWVSLVDRAFGPSGSFDRLSEPEKLYFAIGLLEGEVFNGGFDQYFWNSSGSYYTYAESGLSAIGATQTLELLREAKQIVFATMSVPQDTGERRQVIRDIHGGNTLLPELSNKLDELDKRFWADTEDLSSRLKEFANEHGLIAGPQGLDS